MEDRESGNLKAWYLFNYLERCNSVFLGNTYTAACWKTRCSSCYESELVAMTSEFSKVVPFFNSS